MEPGYLPIEYNGLVRTLQYIQKVKDMQEDHLPCQALKICKTPKKFYKSKFLASGWMIDIKKWFTKRKLERYLEKTKIDWKEMEVEFKASLWEKWAISTKSSKFEYYYEKIMHYSKGSFTDVKGVAQAYLTEALTRAQRSALDQIRMRSHSLEIEKGAWARIPRSARTYKVCNAGHAIEDEGGIRFSSAPTMHT